MPGIDKSIKYIAITTNREGIVCLDARIALEQDLIIGYRPKRAIHHRQPKTAASLNMRALHR